MINFSVQKVQVGRSSRILESDDIDRGLTDIGIHIRRPSVIGPGINIHPEPVYRRLPQIFISTK